MIPAARTVLLVEDNPTDARLVREMLIVGAPSRSRVVPVREGGPGFGFIMPSIIIVLLAGLG